MGGGYGVDLPDKKVFCGESMFSLKSNASKVGFAALAANLASKNYRFIDCQVYTEHLARFGAKEVDRILFIKWLNAS